MVVLTHYRTATVRACVLGVRHGLAQSSEIIFERVGAMNSSGCGVGEVGAASLPLRSPTSGSPAAPHFLQERNPFFSIPLFLKLLPGDDLVPSPDQTAFRSRLWGNGTRKSGARPPAKFIETANFPVTFNQSKESHGAG
jgi:hypothetical protein